MKTVYFTTDDVDAEIARLTGEGGVDQFAVVWDTTESKWAISYREE